MENAMSAKDRLQTLQAALDERGVTDVKFFFNLRDDTPLTTVMSDVSDVLQAYVDGKCEKMLPIGDANHIEA